MRHFRLICADVLEGLAQLPDESVHCVVTSPPYWGLRDYGTDGQVGLEATLDEYVAKMVAMFREVRRVLRSDGTLWLNMGDCYAGSCGAQSREHAGKHAPNVSALSANQVKAAQIRNLTGSMERTPGLKPKDLIGMPWRIAFALQADGWWLRSDILWAKPNPMPESVTDRPTKAHEYVFLLSKSARYYYDADAVRTLYRPETRSDLVDGRWRKSNISGWANSPNYHGANPTARPQRPCHRGGKVKQGANLRSVWTISNGGKAAFPEAHFATFPTKLVEPCVLAGCPEGGVVLDPFCGSGTTGVVALRADRRFVGIELNPEYVQMARRRIGDDAPLLNREDPMLLELAA